MQTRLLGWMAFVAIAITLRGQDKPTVLDATVSKTPLDWNESRWWDIQRGRTNGISLGKSDYVLQGPLVETFRRPSWSATGGHWTRKLLALPVVNLFVPLP